MTTTTTPGATTATGTMTAVRLHAHGDPDVLRAERVDRPGPGPGQALVRVAAAGVNYADVAARRGVYPLFGELPATVGFEAAGTVQAVGPGGDDALVGRRVVAMGPGAYAEYLLADAASLIPVPDGLDPTRAAAFAAQGLTAYGMLHAAGLRAGETVLVHAAAGGVGSLAVQVARLLGADRVVGTAGTPDKRALVRDLGADAAVDYTAPDWPQHVRDALDGRSVDIALDLVGGALPASTVALLTPATGRIVLGGMSGGAPELDPSALITAGVAAIGYTNPVWLARPDFGPTAAPRLLDWITSGALRLVIGATYPLADAAAAHRALETRATTGKVVLLTGHDW
jgi:NADPH2:quinone reductase